MVSIIWFNSLMLGLYLLTVGTAADLDRLVVVETLLLIDQVILLYHRLFILLIQFNHLTIGRTDISDLQCDLIVFDILQDRRLRHLLFTRLILETAVIVVDNIRIDTWTNELITRHSGDGRAKVSRKLDKTEIVEDKNIFPIIGLHRFASFFFVLRFQILANNFFYLTHRC